MPEPLISLCMIVKNEASNLPLVLDSVRGAVDEIIIVDTGSSDDSVELARKHGAITISIQWNRDFSHARNVSLDHAHGKWILFLDADEELNRSDVDELRMCALHEDFEGFFLQVHNHLSRGSESSTIDPILRMFRNRPECRFEGIIHEQIAASILRAIPEAKFHVTNVRVHHYGYSPEAITKWDKVNRNMSLLKEALVTDPNNSFYLYNLGVEHLRTGDVQSAYDAFHMARLNVHPDTSYTHLLYKFEARTLGLLLRFADAIEICKAGHVLFPDYTDLVHYMGIFYSHLGYTRTAIQVLQAAVTLGRPPIHYHTEEGIGLFQTWFILAQLHERTHEYHAAIDCYAESIRHRSSLAPPLYKVFSILKVLGKEYEIHQLLEQKFIINSPEAACKVTEILIRCKCFDEAIHVASALPANSFSTHKLDVALRIALLSRNNELQEQLICGEWFDMEERIRQDVLLKICMLHGWVYWLRNDSEAVESILAQIKLMDLRWATLLGYLWNIEPSELDINGVVCADCRVYVELLSFALQVALANGRIIEVVRWLTLWTNHISTSLATELADLTMIGDFVRTMETLADTKLCSNHDRPMETTIFRDVRLSLYKSLGR